MFRRGTSALPWLCLFALHCGSSFANAAAPVVNYLFPAGAQRGTSVEVRVGGTFERWPVRAWVSGKGVVVTAAKDKGTLTVSVAADAVPGTYWLRLYDEEGASALRPFLVGMLPEVAEREPNDELAKAQAVAPAVVVNGRLEKAGDVDAYAVSLRKGQTLVAALEAHRTLRSPMDGVLQVVSADGFVLEQNNDTHGLDPQLAFAVPRDGTYVVRVFAFPAAPDSGIRLAGAETYIYRLTLTTGGFADHALPLAVPRASPLTLPSPPAAGGEGDKSNRAPPAGESKSKVSEVVRLVGWNLPEQARTLPVPAAPDGDTATVFHPLVANPVRVRLEPHPCWDATGPAAKLPASFAPSFSVTGRIEAAGAARDFPFTGKKGQPLSVQVAARTLGFPVTPVLRILDTGGKQLARAEPTALDRDCELTFNPPQDGAYRAEVRDLHGGAGAHFVYLLRVVPNEPDFDLTVASDRIQIPPGKPLDLPVTINRRNGFAKEVELTVVGLPAGVTAVPAGKGDGKTLSLRFTSTQAGTAGPLRIVGRVAGQPALTRTAQAALAEFGEKTADLWLTVSDAKLPPAKTKKK